MRRKRGDSKLMNVMKLTTGNINSKSVKPKNTCYTYFKVKKSTALTLKLGQDDVDKTCITKETVKKKTEECVVLERPRRVRQQQTFLKQNSMKNQDSSLLCINDVQMIIASQESYEGGVNCHVCGKLYKSRVCFIKHIWEHTVYWNIFEGAKNHERVLSIQAAIILYSGMASQTRKDVGPDLCTLLVTSPHSSETKIERDNFLSHSNDPLSNLFNSSSQEVIGKPEDANMKPEANDAFIRDVLLDNSAKRCRESIISDCMFQMSSSSADKYFKESIISERLFQLPSSSFENKYQCSHIPFLQPPMSPPLSLQTYPASSSEQSLTSLPVQQLSPNLCTEYENRHTSSDAYGTLERNERVSFVSPLKRKRED